MSEDFFCGLKVTRQRRRILEVLKSAREPVTADEIFLKVKEECPGVALTTIYRNLEALRQGGLVEKMLLDNGTALYEYEEKTHHHYLICSGCHKKIKINDCPVKVLKENLEEETGFQITSHHFEIFGFCPECQKKEW